MKTISDPTHLSSLGKNCLVASSVTALRRYVLTAFCKIKRCYQAFLESITQWKPLSGIEDLKGRIKKPGRIRDGNWAQQPPSQAESMYGYACSMLLTLSLQISGCMRPAALKRNQAREVTRASPVSHFRLPCGPEKWVDVRTYHCLNRYLSFAFSLRAYNAVFRYSNTMTKKVRLHCIGGRSKLFFLEIVASTSRLFSHLQRLVLHNKRQSKIASAWRGLNGHGPSLLEIVAHLIK